MFLEFSMTFFCLFLPYIFYGKIYSGTHKQRQQKILETLKFVFKKTRSKYSKPSSCLTSCITASNPMFATTQPQGFVHGGGTGGVGGGGGMQIPASFGLGVGLQQQQQPPQAQHFAQPQPNAASMAFATLNNPFLGMVQTDPTTNNVS